MGGSRFSACRSAAQGTSLPRSATHSSLKKQGNQNCRNDTAILSQGFKMLQSSYQLLLWDAWRHAIDAVVPLTARSNSMRGTKISAFRETVAQVWRR